MMAAANEGLTRSIRRYPSINRMGHISTDTIVHDSNVIESILLDDLRNPVAYKLVMKNFEWQNCAEQQGIDEAIGSGFSIEEAFEKHGYDIERSVLSIQVKKIPDWMRNSFRVVSDSAKTIISELIVRKNYQSFSFGVVTEIFSPKFVKPEVSRADDQLVSVPSYSMLQLAFKKEETWVSLMSRSLETDLARQYTPIVGEIKEFIFDMIMDTIPVLLFY